MCVAGRLCGRAAEREWWLMLLPAPMAALPSCWGRWQWKPRASEAPRRNGGVWTTLRCVDVGVKEDGRRGVDGAQRAEDIGVLPARLGRMRTS